jgi:hypothetical protein
VAGHVGRYPRALPDLRQPRALANLRTLVQLAAGAAPEAPLAVKIPGAIVDTLRGIGGLVSTPVHADKGMRYVPAYSTALPASEETAHGLWVRQIAFENPIRR